MKTLKEISSKLMPSDYRVTDMAMLNGFVLTNSDRIQITYTELTRKGSKIVHKNVKRRAASKFGLCYKAE